MSDFEQGPGWWQASDGKWYPPESHPDAAPTLPPPRSAAPTTPAPARSAHSYATMVQPPGAIVRQKKPWWRRSWAIGLGIVIGVVALLAAFGSRTADDDDVPANEDASTGAAAAGETNDDAVGADGTDGEPGDGADVVEGVDEADGADVVGSRERPFAIGERVTFALDVLGDADRSVWTLIVEGAGSDVTEAVASENQFNDPPPDGSVFYGVPVTITLDSAFKEPLSLLFNIDFEFFGPATLEVVSNSLSEGCGVTPGAIDPFKEVFAGGSISGVVCYAVTEANVAGGVLLTIDSNDGNRLFFATR